MKLRWSSLKFLSPHSASCISQFCSNVAYGCSSHLHLSCSSPSCLWSVTHIARKLTPAPQRSEYIVRNVCPSWHYNALYQLTRGVGGERGGRGEDVEMLGTVWEWGDKKKRALCGRLSDRIWSNSMALAFGKIASFNGHSLQEASPDMRPHMSAQLREGARDRKGEFQEERRQPEGVLEVPYFVNCPR